MKKPQRITGGQLLGTDMALSGGGARGSAQVFYPAASAFPQRSVVTDEIGEFHVRLSLTGFVSQCFRESLIHERDATQIIPAPKPRLTK